MKVKGSIPFFHKERRDGVALETKFPVHRESKPGRAQSFTNLSYLL